MSEYILRVHIKKNNIITWNDKRGEANAGDFLKSILNVGDFTRKFGWSHGFINAGDSLSIPGNGNIYPEL